VNTNFYVPQLVFVDRQGTIRAQYGGSDSFLMYNEEQNIRKMIESLVSESGSRSSASAKKPEKKKD
ncbi:MAG TPA: hypothetical protein VEQ63_13230, partial [Bryobacteraceae bacterium]|nr:hypothetical protein [Bryobacteraceae bacterium]